MNGLRRFTKPLLLALSALALPAAALAAAADFTSLLRGDGGQRASLQQRMGVHAVPGVAVAIIENHQLVLARGYGALGADLDQPVTAHTVFSAGSVSKMANAALLLRLVDAGELSLDGDVNATLRSWQVPPSRYTASTPVSLRTLLAHTAGFNVHGFADFQPDERLPSTLQILTGQSPAKNAALRIRFVPGSAMDYSGGGTTVTQALVEDLTGLDYPQAAQRHLFAVLGMGRSSFVNPLPAAHGNIARAHDSRGRPTALPRGWQSMPEMAASGLWTSANDMALLLIALMQSAAGDSAFLQPGTAIEMMTRQPNSWHGLGPRVNRSERAWIFHHGGANDSEGLPEQFTWPRRHLRSSPVRRASQVIVGAPGKTPNAAGGLLRCCPVEFWRPSACCGVAALGHRMTMPFGAAPTSRRVGLATRRA